jgi:hypothetical protein
VRLRFYKVPEMLLQGWEMIFQESLKLEARFGRQLSLQLQEFKDRHDNRRGIELKNILINEPAVRHHGADLKASDLFPTNPAKQVNLLKPRMKDVHGQIRLVSGHDRSMKPIVPQEGPREDESRWRKSVTVIVLVRHD